MKKPVTTLSTSGCVFPRLPLALLCAFGVSTSVARAQTAQAEADAPAAVDSAAPDAFSAANLALVAAYRDGGDHTPLVRVTEALRALPLAERRGAESALLDVAARPDLTLEAQRALSVWLGENGSAASVPTLHNWAKRMDSADEALRALALIPGAESERALLDLLQTAPEPVRLSVIDALGRRRVRAAVNPLREMLRAEDLALAGASGDALSRLATREAVTALREWTPPTRLEEPRRWALIHAAQVIGEEGNRRGAVRLLRELTSQLNVPPAQQIAVAEALLRHDGRRGLSDTRPLLAVPVVGPRLVRPWLLAALATRQPDRQLRPIVDGFGELPLPTQEALLVQTAQLASPHLRSLAEKAAESAAAELRPAAFLALASTGNLQTARHLVAALETPADRPAAIAALSQQRTEGLDAQLRDAVAGATPDVQAALLEILGQRVDREAVPLLLAAAKGTERAPRAAAFRGLATLARGEDLPMILQLREQLQPADRRLWQEALRAAVRGRNDVSDTLALLRTELDQATAAERPAFLHAMAGFDDPAALDALRALLAEPDVERRKELIRTLSSLRNDHAFTLLIEVAENGSDNSERLLALRGYLDTLGQRRNRWSQTIQAYGRAYRAAERPEEREAALAALASYDSNEARQLTAELRALEPSQS